MKPENKLSPEIKDLLNQSAFEIKMLRRQNEILNARLNMFDDMMRVIYSKPPEEKHQSMSPDLVWQIEKAIA